MMRPTNDMSLSRAELDADLCIHIFTVSAAMVGATLTVIGLLHVITTLNKVSTLADDILAVDSLLFLTSCLSAYWALRTRSSRRMQRLERFTDFVFIVAMIITVLAGFFVTYAFTAWA